MIQILFALILLVFFVAVPKVTYATTDTAFTTIRLNEVGSAIVQAGNKIGFDIGDFIIPFFTKEQELNHADHTVSGQFKNAIVELHTPQNYKDDGKHIDWSAIENPIFYTSLYGAILKTDAQYSNHPPPTDCFISQGLEESPPIIDATVEMQKAQEMDAWYGLHQINPNTQGIVDHNRPVKILNGMNPGEDCKKHDAGVELLDKEIGLTALSRFGTGTSVVGQMITSIFTVITQVVNGVTVQRNVYEKVPNPNEVILTKKKREPYYNCLQHDGGGPESEGGECSEQAHITGGWTAFTLREEDKKPVKPSSEHPYEIKILGFPQKPGAFAYDNENISKTRQKQAACYAVPDTSGTTLGNLQEIAFIGGFVDAAGILGKALKLPIKNMLAIAPECAPPPASTTGGWNCNPNAPQHASAALAAAGQDWADNAIYADACKTENAWAMCHNDVMDRAIKACVDPIFALSMWLHESGASNYQCGQQLTGGVPVEDFGIHGFATTPAQDFSAQLNHFLTLNYAWCPATIKDFFSVYALGQSGGSLGPYKCYGELTTADQTTIDNYTVVIQTIYQHLGGGTLPSWPKGSC